MEIVNLQKTTRGELRKLRTAVLAIFLTMPLSRDHKLITSLSRENELYLKIMG